MNGSMGACLSSPESIGKEEISSRSRENRRQRERRSVSGRGAKGSLPVGELQLLTVLIEDEDSSKTAMAHSKTSTASSVTNAATEVEERCWW